jgi:putative transposase
MAHSLTKLLFHVVFSTSDRRPLIEGDLKARLFPYLGGIFRELGGGLLGAGGTPDHVHLLIWLPATVSVAEALRVVKTNSSKWVHQQWPAHRKFGWQTGYGAFSVSKSNAASVLKYIARQEEHHKKVSFQEEFLQLLQKHEIPYDERYLWK